MVSRNRDELQGSTTENATADAPMDAAAAIRAAKKAAYSVADTAEKVIDERGFERVFDKKALVGKAFVIVDFEDNVEEFGWTMTVRIVMGNKALFFKDGSTGIRQQLIALQSRGMQSMISCPRGLRVSEYQNPYGDGMSKTYYLDDSTV